MDYTFIHDNASGLLKQTLATHLRKEILEGAIKPGERIAEGKWARKYGVAQTSIRKALNILISEGFVQKGHGRSARVIRLSEQDVADIYMVRASLEGIAARQIVERNTDVSDLDSIMDRMRIVVLEPDIRRILECVLQFHMTLCAKSGNHFLLEQFERLTVPLYAFTFMRAVAERVGPEPWARNIPVHDRIMEALRSGDPYFAEHYVSRAIIGFGERAKEVWGVEKRASSAAAAD
jgi:DNA-binding GntR family transcriptional regulator